MRRDKRSRVAGGAILALLSMVPGSFAQSPAAPQPAEQPPGMKFVVQSEPGVVSTGPDDTLALTSFDMVMDRRIVKDKPYSADAITETIQTLGAGNRTVRKTTARFYRDSAGRVRREQSMLPPGMPDADPKQFQIAFFKDPDAGVIYMLVPVDKSAMKTRINPLPEQLKEPPPGYVPGDPTGQVKTEPLGNQLLEGYSCEGTRATRIIPAGQMGNDLPIEIVLEQWYSPELQIVIESKRVDPRSGETHFHLTNISRDEPPSALFMVPAGYTVIESKTEGPPVKK